MICNNKKIRESLCFVGVIRDNSDYIDTFSSNLFLNDNGIARMLLYPDSVTGRVPSLLDIKNNDSYPVEVQKFINSLLREYPQTFKSFSCDDEAFEFIRSRYDQYGQENESYINSLTSILKDYENELSKESQDTSSSE